MNKIVPTCCSVGKGKRGAGKGERNSRGTENLGHTLPSTLQERNRIYFAFSQSSGAFNTQRKETCTWRSKKPSVDREKPCEIPVQLAHNSQNRDY